MAWLSAGVEGRGTRLSIRGHARRLAPYLKGLVAAGLLVVIGLHVDWSEFLALAGQIRVIAFVPVVFLVVGDRVFMALKWWYLLRGLGVDANVVEVVFQYFMAGALGTATQWAPSGDIARAVTVGGHVGRRSVVAASVVLEKLGGLAATGGLAAFSIWILTSRYDLGQWSGPISGIGVAALACTVIGALAFWPPALERMVGIGLRLPVEAVRDAMSDVADATALLRGTPAGPVFLVLTCLEQLVPLIVLFLLSSALGFELTVVEIVAVFPSILFLSRLPLSLDAFGVREALFVFLFGLVGISTEVSFALTLADRVATLAALGLGIGVIWLFRRFGSSDPLTEDGGVGEGS